MLFDVGFLHNWRAELKKMNKGKEGANYRYPNSSILMSARHRTCVPTSIPSIRRLSKNDVVTHKETQRSSTRLHNHLVEVVRTKINLNSNVNLEKDNIVIAVDSTGIKVTNRGEWILDKWKNKRKRKGFIKIHVAVNIKTKKIISMIVTKEDVHDGKMLKEIVDFLHN